MRVAMVAGQAPPVYGGAGTQALRLGQLLAERGATVELLTLNQMSVARNEQVGRVSVRRCPGESLAGRLGARGAQRARTVLFVTWLTWRLLTGRYDILHVHGAYWWTLPAAFVARVRRVPLVVKVTRLGEDDAETVARKRIKRVPMGALYGLSFRWASTVVGISAEIVRRHEKHWPRVPVRHLPNGVDTDRFHPAAEHRATVRQSLGIPVGDRIVLFAGYLAPLKGLRSLLEAWRDLDGDPVTRDAVLVLAGPDRGFYRELDPELLSWIREEGRSGRVQQLGHVDAEMMPELYRAADVYVLPSLAEGMPNSLLEALASGLPAVVTDIPGTRDVVAGCSAATKVPPDDAPVLGRALREVLGAASEGSASLANTAVGHVRSRFSLQARARQYEQLYAELLSP